MAYPNSGTYPSASASAYAGVTNLIAALPARATSETIEASHMNLVQAEIIEIEAALGGATDLLANPAGGSAYSTLAAKLTGIYNAANTSTSNHSALGSGVHGVGTGSVVGTTLTQTLTNKTLTDVTVNGGSIDVSSLSVGGVAVVDLTSSQTLRNKTLVNPVIRGGSGSITAETGAFTNLSADTLSVGGKPVVTQGSLDNSTFNGVTIVNSTLTGGTVNASTLQKSGVDAATISGAETLTNKTLSAPAISGTVSGNFTFGGNVTFSNQISVPDGYGLVPPGTIIMWYGKAGSVPSGWLECKGQSVSAGTYPQLASVFGVASGSFNLPDFMGSTSGRFPRATDDASKVGDTGGRSSFKLNYGNIPPHTHSISHDHTVSVGRDYDVNKWDTGDNMTNVPTGHQHTGFFRNDFAKGYGNWDVVRPQSTGGYATDGNQDDHPDITYKAGAHTHPVNITGQSATTSGKTPNRDDEEGLSVTDVVPPYMYVRFLIKT